MPSYVYECPKCKNFQRQPGKCQKCNAEHVKKCANCRYAAQECICN